MRWVRVHTHFDIWASNGPSPTFCITSDDDGEAFIEIAKRPELLYRPQSDSDDAWNLYFSAHGSNNGAVSAETITITQGRADYTMPQAVWEHMSRVADETSEASRRLYYRVKARPRGGGDEGYASHTDTQVQQGNVPSLEVLPLSGDLRVDNPVADSQAVARLDLFSRFILAIIQLLPESDSGRRALSRVLTHSTYEGQVSPTIRANILKLFVWSGGNGRAVFERLLDLRVVTGSRAGGGFVTEPALFFRDERNEGTLLDHLLALWSVQLDTRIPVAQSEVIFEAILEVIDPPGQMNQGAAGTCAATSVQTYTAMRNPAEYARWCRYILDRRQNHRVRLANGQFMRANPEAFDVATWRQTSAGATGNWQRMIGRTFSERGIQAAIMDYANFRHRYDPERDTFVNWLNQVRGSGLFNFELSRALEAIFNQPWKFDYAGGSINSAPNAGAADNLFSHFQNGGLPATISILWGGGGHVVLALRVENNRVIFRNPQYRGSFPVPGYTNGQSLNQPTRQLHNVARAEESMDLAGLQAAIRGFCHESGSVSDRGYTLAEIPSHLQGTVNPTA